MRLKDRVAIVTGGAGGIGSETCRTLIREGAAVVVSDINYEGAQAVAKEIAANGGRALAIKCDVRDTAQANEMAKQTVERFGRIDILVNNAGAWTPKKFSSMEPKEWDFELDLCLYGTFQCTRAAQPFMTQQKYGRIVNIASDAGRSGGPNFTIYSSAKAAVMGFTRAFAKEVGRFGITVNAIAPGFTETAPGEDVINRIGRDRLIRDTPLGRLAQPQDIANAILFFASDEASFITGQTLSVNGGLLTF